jgi:flavin reductase (DIM6/NTAB) family NADH-FMN oxidoreductase RutF
LDADHYRNVMARHAAGLVVVSAAQAGGWRGLTASTFSAVSVDPPLVLVCLERFAATRDAIVESGLFNVSLLTAAQEFVAERFAGRAPAVGQAWKEVPHRLGSNGIPLVEGCLAWLECRVVATHDAGDHEIVVGEVLAAGEGAGDPLVLWDRAFWRLTPG